MSAKNDASIEAEDLHLLAHIPQNPMQVFKGESFLGSTALYMNTQVNSDMLMKMEGEVLPLKTTMQGDLARPPYTLPEIEIHPL